MLVWGEGRLGRLLAAVFAPQIFTAQRFERFSAGQRELLESRFNLGRECLAEVMCSTDNKYLTTVAGEGASSVTSEVPRVLPN